MRKILFVLMFVFSLTISAQSQSTSVTATITDNDGQLWSNGTYTVNLFNPSQTLLPVYTNTGLPVQPTYSGNINSSGVLSVSLPNNAKISPSNTRWIFTLCSGTSANCVTLSPVTITGTTQNLSTLFSSLVGVPRFSSGANSYGYLDVEVKNPISGSMYYNVTISCYRYYDSANGWQCIDNGNQINPKSFGAKCDGTTDDTTAFIAAETFAVSHGKTIYVPPANCVIGTGYSNGASVFVLSNNESWFFDPRATFIIGGPVSVFYCGTQGAAHSSINIVNAHMTATGANQYTYTGLLGACIGSHIQIAANYPNIGMSLNFAEENVFDFQVYKGSTVGIQFINNSNSNVVTTVGITGNNVANSIGVSFDANSSSNLFNGNEITGWSIGVQNSGWVNKFNAQWIENNLTLAVSQLAGSLDICGFAVSGMTTVSDGAIINGGYGCRSGNQPNHRANSANLTAYYPMNEGTGTTLYDWSGNGNHATISGSYSWVSGPYGFGVSLPAASNFGNRISIPASAISYATPFTIAIMQKIGATTDAVTVNNLQITDSNSHAIVLQLQPNVGQTPVYYTPGSAQGNLFDEPIQNGKYAWTFLTIDPVANKITNLNPAYSPGVSVSPASSFPLTGTPTSIYLGLSGASVDSDIPASIAIWQRALTLDESKNWIENPTIYSAATIPVGSILTTLGDTVYRGASGLTRLPGNTSATIKALTQTGNGTTSAAPVWSPVLSPTNTFGCLSGFDYYGCLVFSTMVSESTASGYTTAFTTTVAGLYEIEGGLLTTTTGGTTYTITLYGITNEVTESGSSHAYPLAFANITTPTKTTNNYPSRLVNLGSGIPIQWSTAGSGTAGGTWNKYLTVKYVHP